MVICEGTAERRDDRLGSGSLADLQARVESPEMRMGDFTAPPSSFTEQSLSGSQQQDEPISQEVDREMCDPVATGLVSHPLTVLICPEL